MLTNEPIINPKITVVTPSLNQGEFIEECIDSILSQNYPNLEYFVIDGGSSDKTIDVIKSYEEHIDYWVSEKDAGQSNAINKGFRKANGDLVVWLNADDYFLPDCFKTIASVYQENKDASFIFGDGYRVDINRTIKAGFFPDNDVRFNERALTYGLNYILQPSAFINRECIRRINYLNEELHYGMDSDLWMRLVKISSPVAINSFLSCSREYGETKTSMGAFKRVEELRKISHEHSGMSISPGSLCYFLDTLHRYVNENNDKFSSDYLKAIEKFWAESAKNLSKYGAKENGFPL